MCRKEKRAVKGGPNKSRSSIEAERGVDQEETRMKISLMGINRKEGLTFARIDRKTPVLRPILQLNQGSLCVFRNNWYRGGEKPDSQVVSIKRTADERR